MMCKYGAQLIRAIYSILENYVRSLKFNSVMHDGFLSNMYMVPRVEYHINGFHAQAGRDHHFTSRPQFWIKHLKWYIINWFKFNYLFLDKYCCGKIYRSLFRDKDLLNSIVSLYIYVGNYTTCAEPTVPRSKNVETGTGPQADFGLQLDFQLIIVIII